MYLVKTPRLIQNLFPNFKWSIPVTEKKVYLTFDDGPIPEVTPWVLDLLKEYDFKATFFCVGENAMKYPEILERIIAEGHTVGNHTFNHMNGWVTENIKYFHNIRRCAHLINSNLFRPPYGRLKPKQAQFIQRHYDIIMWSLLSGDFDPALSKEMCLENVVSNINPGATETCNGIDDDCDGTVDAYSTDQPCNAGVGACQTTGQIICDNLEN